MQRITLIGNLTNDPESRTTTSGQSVCAFTIAVNRRFANKDGEKQTDFFRIQAWRGLADTCARCLSKGRKVAVIGELQARLYEAKDGTTRMSLDVQADEVEFLSPKDEQKKDRENRDGYDQTPEASKPNELAGFTDINSDDLPF